MQYSIVSYLDNVATSKIRELQQELSHITGSVASLKSWEPHITVGDGIELSEQELPIFQSRLTQALVMIKPFKVALHGFVYTDNRTIGINETSTPYVISVGVQQNDSLLKLVEAIADRTRVITKWYNQPRPYNPHATLAFRDLSKEGYELGLNHLRNKTVHIETLVDHVSLVEKLTDKDVEIAKLPLR